LVRGGGGSPEFEEVVGQANELPFGVQFGDAPHGELAETARLLDLTEHWLDLSFAFFVDVTPCFRSQRAGHTLLRGERFRDASLRVGRELFVVLQALCGDVRSQRVRANGWRVVVAVVARVGHEIFRTLRDLGRVEVGFHRGEHRGEHRGDLSDIVGLRRDSGGDDELEFIDQRWSIATLVPPFIRGLHDLRVGVGEVALSLRLGLHVVEVDRRRFLPLGFTNGVLSSGLRARLCIQRRLGFANLREARLASLQFVGQFIAATVRSLLSVFGLIFGLRLSPQFTNLLLQPDLLGLHAVVTHGLVSRRIRFDLRPVQRQPSHLEQPRRRRQSQHFDEQLLKRGDVTTTKFTDRVPVFFLRRQAGVSSPTITRHATSCSHRCMIFCDERVPVA